MRSAATTRGSSVAGAANSSRRRAASSNGTSGSLSMIRLPDWHALRFAAERVPQFAPRREQLTLGCAGMNVEHASNLLVREALDVKQDEDFAHARRQRCHGPFDVHLKAGRSRWRYRLRWTVFSDFLRAPPGLVHAVDEHTGQPRTKRGLKSKLAERSRCAEPGFLNHVFDVRRLETPKPPGHSEQRRRVRAVKLKEAVLIAPAHVCLHQAVVVWRSRVRRHLTLVRRAHIKVGCSSCWPCFARLLALSGCWRCALPREPGNLLALVSHLEVEVSIETTTVCDDGGGCGNGDGDWRRLD